MREFYVCRWLIFNFSKFQIHTTFFYIKFVVLKIYKNSYG